MLFGFKVAVTDDSEGVGVDLSTIGTSSTLVVSASSSSATFTILEVDNDNNDPGLDPMTDGISKDHVAAEFYQAMMRHLVTFYLEACGHDDQSFVLPDGLLQLEWMLGRLELATRDLVLVAQKPNAFITVQEDTTLRRVNVLVWIESLEQQCTATFQVSYDCSNPRCMTWSLPTMVMLCDEDDNDRNNNNASQSLPLALPTVAKTATRICSVLASATVLSELCNAMLSNGW